jgi:hypothetical protein
MFPSLQTGIELRRRALGSLNFAQNLPINTIAQPNIVKITSSQTPSISYERSNKSSDIITPSYS